MSTETATTITSWRKSVKTRQNAMQNTIRSTHNFCILASFYTFSSTGYGCCGFCGHEYGNTRALDSSPFRGPEALVVLIKGLVVQSALILWRRLFMNVTCGWCWLADGLPLYLCSSQFVKRRNVVTIFLKIQLLFFSFRLRRGKSPTPHPQFFIGNYCYLKIARVFAAAQHL